MVFVGFLPAEREGKERDAVVVSVLQEPISAGRSNQYEGVWYLPFPAFGQLLTFLSYTPRKSHRIVVTLEPGDKAEVRKKNPTLADVRTKREQPNPLFLPSPQHFLHHITTRMFPGVEVKQVEDGHALQEFDKAIAHYDAHDPIVCSRML
jgi:hypothetical protein